MTKHILSLTVLFITIATACWSDQVISLKDGSKIKGELAGVQDGVYTVKTPAIGDVRVAAGDVVSINSDVLVASATSKAAVPANDNLNQEIATQQQRLMANPEAVSQMQQLAQDPEV